MALFRARVAIGVSRLGRCAFITLTYQAGRRNWPDVGYVKKDWAALWRVLRLKESPLRNLKWIRVMELTKVGTPHHHLTVGPLSESVVIKCWKEFEIVRYLERFSECGCVAHEFARAWVAVTLDSFIVHATPVWGPDGAGGYMGKYMQKTFAWEERMKLLGMERRWSSSLGWPGNSLLKLKQTDEGGWDKIRFMSRELGADEFVGPDDLLVRVGDDLVKARLGRARQKQLVNKLRSVVND